jgi:hypothetical protein
MFVGLQETICGAFVLLATAASGANNDNLLPSGGRPASR